MRKIILVSLFALSLGACASVTTLLGTTVSPTQVIVAANSFDAIEATATNYLTLPICPAAKICRTQAGVNAIVPAIRAGRQARSQLEAYVTANPGQPVPVSLYNAVMTAVSSLQSLLSQYNAS